MYGYHDDVNRYYQRWQQLSPLPQARKWSEPTPQAIDDIHSTFLQSTLTLAEKTHGTTRNLPFARAILYRIPLATSYHTRTLHTLRVQDRSQLHYHTVVFLFRLVTSLSHHGAPAILSGSTVPSRIALWLGLKRHTSPTTTATSQR